MINQCGGNNDTLTAVVLSIKEQFAYRHHESTVYNSAPV